jgi:hypothetical protein
MGQWAAILAAAAVCLVVVHGQYQQAPQYQQKAPQYQQQQYQSGYQNYSKPYGNYSSGNSMYGNYSKPPSYPPAQYNQSQPKYGNNTGYQQDYWATYWDHENQAKHQYDQEAFDWVNANVQPAWQYALGAWDALNGQYYGYGQTCGYTGNPYNTYETRNAKRAELLLFMAEYYWNNYQGDKSKLHLAMLNLNAYTTGIYELQDCLAENYGQWQGQCDQYQKYSRPDQICNNVAYPTWGAWLDIGERITLKWRYQNGIWQPMQYNQWPDYNGQIQPLVDAKQLANILDSDSYGQCYNLDTTMLHLYFAQFMVHDVIYSLPVTVTGYNGKQVKPECCRTPDNCLHYSCTPWKAQWQNPYTYQSYPVCEPLSFNQAGIDYCTPLPKDHVNQETSYIDGSQIYGATCEDAAGLRSFVKGKLLVNKGKYGLYAKNVLLPVDNDPDVDECDTSYPDNDLKCLLAGDDRNNQHLGVQVMHTMFLRLHNRLASSCAKWLEKYYLSSDVVDEICYQEVRRYTQAILQNMFYRDHLPIELGQYVASNPVYGLSLDYVLPYDAAVHASAWPEYVYAAGRLHTMSSHWGQVVDEAKRAQGLTEPDAWYGITDWFKKAYALLWKKQALNELVSNALYDPQQCYDPDFVPELRNMNPTYGGPQHDMLWVNIKRPREFGMPWYTEIREWCGMGYVDDWSQLQGVWHDHCLQSLPSTLYHVKNIESYVGMICEKPMPGALVGPTAGCILQRQYYNLREGDRWFFDRNGLNYDQLGVIKKFNMGKIVCITTNLDYVTENVFRAPNAYGNKYQSCNAYDDITEDDLSVLWSTLPYAAGDYRTCKDYAGYQAPPQQGYQNNTYGGYQNNTYQQAPNYQGAMNYQGK